MRSNLEILLVACLPALQSASSAVITKRIIKPAPQDGKSSGSGLAVFPINVAGKVGDTVTLICEAGSAPPESKVYWWEFATKGNGQMISVDSNIVISHPNSYRYTIIRDSPTKFYLQIKDLQLADAGTYMCLDGNGFYPQESSAQAELVVLEEDPQCTSPIPLDGVVLEKRSYEIFCKVNYKGAMAPLMTWTGPKPFEVQAISSNNEVSSTLSFTVNPSFDNKEFKMHANFTEITDVYPGVASNAPKYDTFYNAGKMSVYCKCKK